LRRTIPKHRLRRVLVERLRVRPAYDADGDPQYVVGVQTQIPNSRVNPDLQRLPILQ
jgi:hypothetical protein